MTAAVGNFLGRFAHRRAVGAHEAGRNGGLRAGAALEQAARDQEPIGALFGHCRWYRYSVRSSHANPAGLRRDVNISACAGMSGM